MLTQGEKGGHCSKCRECKNSARFLGFEDIEILNFKDTGVFYDGDLVSAIREKIDRYNPEVIYGHTSHDNHQDHLSASLATQSAAKQRVPNVLLFETPSTTVDFVPHYFNVITESYSDKLKSLRKYKSQLNREGILDLDWIRSKALFWGVKTKPKGYRNKKCYAEAFEINHIINNIIHY